MLDYAIPDPSALEPPARWAQLRTGCPVAPVRLPSGDGATLLTRYADVKQVLSDPRLTRRLNAPGAARLTDSASGGVFGDDMALRIPDSGEDHQRWRRQVGRWFTVKRMTELRPGMTAMADRLIDRMVASGAPADLKAALGFPLPVWVSCDLLGVPDSDRDKFAHWSDTLLNLTRSTEREIAAAQAEFAAYLGAHVAATRETPGDNLLGALVTDGELSEDELIATGQALLVTGHETTANMIGKMIGMLLADRSRWERLLADPSLVRPAVEEVLRFDANPGLGMPRYLTEGTSIDETVLPRDTTVMCGMGAANRDETAFAGAAELDLARTPDPHLAFGAGAHSCLGRALTRTELQVVLEVLLRRLPELRLAVAPEDLGRVEGLVVGGLRTVPVRW